MKSVVLVAGESSFEVNKPLMLQPIVPRYANVGDRIDVKALVHNRSAASGRFRVSLEMNENSTIVRDHVIDEDEEAQTSWHREEVTIAAGASVTVPFPVNFTRPGEAVWEWLVTPVSRLSDESNNGLYDAVQSRFSVSHPIPMLNGRAFAQVEAEKPIENLLAEIEPVLLKGEGEVTLQMGNSRLVDAASAIEYMLAYPYG